MLEVVNDPKGWKALGKFKACLPKLKVIKEELGGENAKLD